MNLEEKINYLRKKGRQKRKSSHWYKKWWGILLLLIFISGSIYILSIILLVLRLKQNPSEMEFILKSGLLQNIIENKEEKLIDVKIIEGRGEYFIGTTSPLATIVVFSDFTCPYCQKSADTVGKLAIKYGDKIKIIVRDLPVLSNDSIDLAMAARCAGDQGKYWLMYYKLFELQGQFSINELDYIAQSIEINDINKFSTCLSEKKYLNDLIKNATDGQFLKIQGTPAWYINGLSAGEGAIPFEAWQTFLDQLLIEENYE